MLTDNNVSPVMLVTDINRNISLSQVPSAPAMPSPIPLTIPTITFEIADIENNNDPTVTDNYNEDRLNNNITSDNNNNDTSNSNSNITVTETCNITTYTVQNNGNNNTNDNNNILCLSNDVINIHDIPISVIRQKCRQLLSTRLNSIKVILSEDGVPRDWRGVLHWLNLETINETHLETKSDKMGELLTHWMRERKECATMGQLHEILGCIDRWDVVDDTSDFFAEDAKIYLNNKARSQQQQQNHVVQDDTSQNPMTIFNPEANILTIDDATLAQQGLPPQQYDAFVLFADEDIDFATEIIEKMEEFGLKICVKERDLIGGSFQHEAILRMISERCERLIVVLSPAFLSSPANTFFVTFAQALAIEQRQRKIIPCLYQPCKLPPMLSYYYLLVYKTDRYFNFWDKLRDSIKKIPSRIIVNNISNTMPRITITEMDAPAALRPAVHQPPQSQQAVIRNLDGTPVAANESSKTGSRKRKEKTPSPKSAKDSKSGSKSSLPTTPTGLKQFWPPSPKLRANSTMSSSMWTLAVEDNNSLDKENKHCRSTLSLNSPSSSPSTLYKKQKWYKKLLSPNSGSAYKLSADSDSTTDGTEKARKKKKWYKRKFGSRTKMRERELAKEI